MRTKQILPTTLLALLAAGLLGTAQAVTLQTVTIGNPGNPNDPATGSLYGGVNHIFSIGTYEVTLMQYTSFLNAVAATDTYGLYNLNMATDLNIAGITRSGSSGSYTYAVLGSGLRPVSYVSWYDAARFTNWLSNGQPAGLQAAGTTETGSYALTGNNGIITNTGTGAYWLPSESELYKAAYYDPNKGGPGVDGYWTYPTKSDSAPGNVIGSSANQANYITDLGTNVYSVTQSSSFSSTQNYLTDAGAFAESGSAYGTFDQGGNVWEWNDAVIDDVLFFSRGLRGGAWKFNANTLRSSGRNRTDPAVENRNFGFRIATIPEPASVCLLLGGGALLAMRRR